MKKILLSTIVLLFFSISIGIFQISCQKEATAETAENTATSQVNKIIYMKWNNTYPEFWICNYDGTNNLKVNLSLPSGIAVSENPPFMSPDGQKIFFTAGVSVSGQGYSNNNASLYSCNSDGSGVTKIVSGNGSSIQIGGAY